MIFHRQLVIFAGKDANGGLNNDVWLYDFVLNKYLFMNGNITVNAASNAQKIIGARYNHSMVYHPNGYLIVFGGYGYDIYSTAGLLNDLWQYDFVLNEWAYLSDYQNVKGQFLNPSLGIIGSRCGHSSALLSNGSLIVFAGNGIDYNGITGFLNDLWLYNFDTGYWSFLQGNVSCNINGNYSSYIVGSRYLHSMVIQPNDSLFVFGGYGCASSGCGYLNDLWQYDFVLRQWTYLNGDKSTDNGGAYSFNGKVGSRSSHSMVMKSNDTFLLFGGYGFDSILVAGDLNDLWEYNITMGEWNFLYGDDIVDKKGNYSTNGTIGSREAFSMVINPNNNDLVIFGGYGIDNTGLKGPLNDIWNIYIYQFNNITNTTISSSSSSTTSSSSTSTSSTSSSSSISSSSSSSYTTSSSSSSSTSSSSYSISIAVPLHLALLLIL
jgi:N-acetylneuraminic acid mutarotase